MRIGERIVVLSRGQLIEVEITKIGEDWFHVKEPEAKDDFFVLSFQVVRAVANKRTLQKLETMANLY